MRSATDETRVLAVTAHEAVRISPGAAARLAALATDLLPSVETIAAEVTRRAVLHEPDLVVPGDPASAEAVAHSTLSNVGAIFSMLAYGVPGSAIEPPAGAIELFEQLADRDDGLTVVLRGYRLGIAEAWQIWARHVRDHVDDPQELYEILAASTSHMLTYVDRMSQELVGQWNETRRRRRHGLDISPDELVRLALFGDPASGAADALARLDYDAAATHVALALPPDLDDAQVAQLASRLRTVARAASVTTRRDAAWLLWLGLDEAPGDRLRDAIVDAVDVEGPVGLSEPAAGLDGFRTAYREALDAQRVAVLRGATGITRHRDVALLAVLVADQERARALARSELGPLAVEDEVTCRLRETLRAYLACGESHVGAAERLFVHQKTVAYRIRQAEQILGRKVAERRTELEAALLVHEALERPAGD
jgi:hypothetical protein